MSFMFQENVESAFEDGNHEWIIAAQFPLF